MTATLPEQLRHFHITGHGLDDAVPVLTAEAVAAGRALPPEGDFHASSAITLPIAAILKARGPVRDQFTAQLRQTAERLDDLLALDMSHGEDAGPATALGSVGGKYLNFSSLTAALRRRTNPVHRMSPERRERCQAASNALHQALAIVHPPFTLFHEDTVPNPLHGELHHSGDPSAAAFAHIHSQLHAMEATLRALRVARLELDDAYDPLVHDAILHRFRWEAAHAEELAAQSPVIVALTSAQAAASPLQSLSRLLRSGCPVHVIVTQPSLAAGDLKAEAPDLAQLAIAHRDAYVLQSSLACRDHLLPALEEMAQVLTPALAVIATPSAGGWAESVILPLAKAWPLFVFNPSRGRNWRECLVLHRVDSNGWTAAHAAALNPTLAHHFRILPEIPGDQDPIELDLYLVKFQERAPLAVPFITMADGTRIAVSRDVASYCHDRQRAYEVLEQWTAAPAPAKPDALTAEGRELAMRQGAEAAIARVLELLNKEGGKP